MDDSFNFIDDKIKISIEKFLKGSVLILVKLDSFQLKINKKIYSKLARFS